jgi:hypothetical protein
MNCRDDGALSSALARAGQFAMSSGFTASFVRGVMRRPQNEQPRSDTESHWQWLAMAESESRRSKAVSARLLAS